MLHTDNKIIKHKVGLLNLAEELGNVSKACQIMSELTQITHPPPLNEGGDRSFTSKLAPCDCFIVALRG